MPLASAVVPAGGDEMTGTAYLSVPDELKALPQWVVWRLEEREGKTTKIPYNARYPTRRAASDRPETWSDFRQAAFTLENEPGLKFSGIGFVLLPPYIGVDFDHIRDPTTGTIERKALDEIRLLDSYSELSPSGTGVHIIVRGSLPDDGKKAGDREVYTKGRYFTVTGMHLEGTPLTINENQGAIETLWQRWFPALIPTMQDRKEIPPHEEEDDTIIARCAKIGKFKALFEGNAAGYPSQSEADLALCTILALYTRDKAQINRIFRKSGLYRDKWDREDYSARTIDKALLTAINAGQKEKKTSPEIDFSAIADEIRREMHVISVRQNLFLQDEGVYTTNAGQIEAEIQNKVAALGYQKSIVTAKKEVLSYLADHNPHSVPPFNRHYGYLPVKNGILHITETGVSIHPYTDEFLFSYKLPVVYDPDADRETVREVFSEWVDEENVLYLIQLPAQAIVQSWGDCFKTAYLFEGPKNAGKTTYLEFLGNTIGQTNYSTTPLYDLLYNKYAKYDLLGKILNLSDDLSEIPLKNLGEFKKLTGGMPVTVERKHCDRITMSLPAVHAFTCNRPPKCTVTDDPAWWDRWIYLYFGNTFTINPQWKREFFTKENFSGFLLLIVDSIREIMAGKFHKMDPTLVEMMWTSASDTVSKFLHEECILDPAGVVQKDAFFEAYCQSCRETKQRPIPKNILTQELGKRGITTTRLKVGKKRIQAYRGAILKKVGRNPDLPDQTTLSDDLGQEGQGSLNVMRARKNEIENDSTYARVYACISERTLTPLTQVTNYIQVRVHCCLEPFMGVDGETYQARPGQIITLPGDNANVLINRGYASPVHSDHEGDTRA